MERISVSSIGKRLNRRVSKGTARKKRKATILLLL
jgi:hypothetical protein